MSRYTVLVQGEREGEYTSVITADFTTGEALPTGDVNVSIGG